MFQSTDSGCSYQLTDVLWPAPDHLYWPQLDADLSVESIRDPTKFPLVSKAASQQAAICSEFDSCQRNKYAG
jgi:hypothetical protein